MMLRLSHRGRVEARVIEKSSTAVVHRLSNVTNIVSIVSFVGVYLVAYMSECASPTIGALLFQDDLIYGGSFFLLCLLTWMYLAFLEERMDKEIE